VDRWACCRRFGKMMIGATFARIGHFAAPTRKGTRAWDDLQ
jgi:hypothetical protein